MNCEQFKLLVHDVARDEGLGFATLNEALEHADGCEKCDALLEEAEALTAKLRVLSDQHKIDEAPARVEAALLRSFHQIHASSSSSARYWMWTLTGLGGAAAAALLMIVLMHHAKQVLGLSSQTEKTSVALVQSTDQAALSEVDASLTGRLPLDLTDGWPFAFEDDTSTGSFVPLSEAFDPTSLDVDSVLRVSIPRSALQNLGVYLDSENDDPVVADLVLSNDGTPQAIRVVNW